jgi:uncharacterized OB-fold protein
MMAAKRPDRVPGSSHDEFWAWCNRGELRLQRCQHCGKLAWPVVHACEACAHTEFAWARMSGRGKIVSWCAFEHDYYQGMLAIPYDTVLVELEEGPLFISNPVNLAQNELAYDMAVTLTFLDCEDSAGSFQLPVFEKA